MSLQAQRRQRMETSSRARRQRSRLNNTTTTGSKKLRSKIKSISTTKSVKSTKRTKQSRHEAKRVDTPSFDISQTDIIFINRCIRQWIGSLNDKLPYLYGELDVIKTILKNSSMPLTRINAAKHRDEIRREIIDIESNSVMTNYVHSTSSTIATIRDYQQQKANLGFVKRGDDRRKEQMIIRQLQRHKEVFMTEASKFVNLQGITWSPDMMNCVDCGSTNIIIGDDLDEVFMCAECGTEMESLNHNVFYKDMNRVNMTPKFKYSKMGHFIAAVEKYQGKKPMDKKKLHKVISGIRRMIKKRGLSCDLEDKKCITKNQIYTHLESKKEGKFYEQVNIIYFHITGCPCPDISHLEDKIMELFEQQEAILDKMEIDRSNSINVNYKLYKLLQKLGWKCRKNDFYMLKTENCEQEHDMIMQRCWDTLGWDWIPTF